jgi:hypothetical protein
MRRARSQGLKSGRQARLLQMAQAWRALAAKRDDGKRKDPEPGE